MTTFADLVHKHARGVAGGITAGNISRERAKKIRAEHDKAIRNMPEFMAGKEFVRNDVLAATGLDVSVANRALADMVQRNVLSERVIDCKGTIGYTPVCRVKVQWRKRPGYLADCPYTPRWF